MWFRVLIGQVVVAMGQIFFFRQFKKAKSPHHAVTFSRAASFTHLHVPMNNNIISILPFMDAGKVCYSIPPSTLSVNMQYPQFLCSPCKHRKCLNRNRNIHVEVCLD